MTRLKNMCLPAVEHPQKSVTEFHEIGMSAGGAPNFAEFLAGM
jgi:hypothetical protein